MKALILAMGAPAMMLAVGMAIADTAPRDLAPLRVADATPAPSATGLVPLNQVENVPERVATARVTDADGRVIGAVQRVEIQNGRPTSLDIALLGSETTIALDAGSVRYDAANNVVATGESVAQLLARPKT